MRPDRHAPALPRSLPMDLAYALTAAGTVALGIAPAPALDIIAAASRLTGE